MDAPPAGQPFPGQTGNVKVMESAALASLVCTYLPLEQEADKKGIDC